jgi:hypothetical protein
MTSRPGPSRIVPSGLKTLPDDRIHRDHGAYIHIAIVFLGAAAQMSLSSRGAGISGDEAASTHCISHDTLRILQ